MTAALIALGGVIIGAVLAQLGAALSERRQVRAEARRWRRDQLASAYAQALRYLHRAANRRSEFMDGDGAAVLRPEHLREWFDDLVEAQVWLRTVTQYCEIALLDRIRQAADSLDTHVERLVSGERFREKDFSILWTVQSCIATLNECARPDGLINGNARQAVTDEDDPLQAPANNRSGHHGETVDAEAPQSASQPCVCGSTEHTVGMHNGFLVAYVDEVAPTRELPDPHVRRES